MIKSTENKVEIYVKGLTIDQGRFPNFNCTDFSKFTSCFVCNTYVTSEPQIGIKTHIQNICTQKHSK